MNCYNCQSSLNTKTSSAEHIIPNAIGGTIKSTRLLCRKCNNEFGWTVDAALANDFEHLVSFLNIERDRSKKDIARNLTSLTEDWHPLNDGGTAAPTSP